MSAEKADFFIMPLNKEQKEKIVQDIKNSAENQKAMVFVGFSGLKVKDTLALKAKLKAINGVFKVCKKTLLNIVLRDPKYKVKARELDGQVAVAFGLEDEAALAKTIYDFSREQESLKILGGFFNNKFEGKEFVVEMAKLPPRIQLLARLLGSMKSPISNLTFVLKANIKGLVVALNAIKENK